MLVICGLAVANVSNIYDVSSAAKSAENGMSLDVPVVPSLWIIVGVAGLAFILSFMGCCGALKESSCLLYSFSVLLAIILAVQLVVISFCYYKKDDFKTEINNMMNSSLHDYPKINDNLVRKSWDALQTDVIHNSQLLFTFFQQYFEVICYLNLIFMLLTSEVVLKKVLDFKYKLFVVLKMEIICNIANQNHLNQISAALLWNQWSQGLAQCFWK